MRSVLLFAAVVFCLCVPAALASPPTPDPAEFIDPNGMPTGISDSSIEMTAVTGSDPNGPVEYYFVNETTLGHDSGW